MLVERVVQETRHFQEDTGLTRSGRSKEQAEDYRYFPEPDLVPVEPDAAWIETLRAALPERSSIRRKRLQEAWAVPDKEMAAMINADVLDIVEATVLLGADPTKSRTGGLERFHVLQMIRMLLLQTLQLHLLMLLKSWHLLMPEN